MGSLDIRCGEKYTLIIEIETPKIVLPKGERTRGVHLSNIIKCIATDTGILQQYGILEELDLVDSTEEITDLVALLRISIGLAWEAWYIPTQLPQIMDHPGEIQVDGVYMNPDGKQVSVVTTLLEKIKRKIQKRVHEIKATYKSTKTVGLTQADFLRNYKKNWMWLSQLMAYCRAEGTCYGDLHALFICSNYKFPIVPDIKIYHFEFEEEELEDNWNLLTQYRDERLAVANS